MIIDITKSMLFRMHPDIRFAKWCKLPVGFWTEIYRRHKLLGYSNEELREFYLIKTGKIPTAHLIERWLWRTEIYHITEPLIKKGVRHVNSSIFREYENLVIQELTKSQKEGSVSMIIVSHN
jgi:hypothetical protein